MKRLWLILLIPLLTGCWDSENIEELSLVVGVGIDKSKKKDEIMLTQQILVPPGNSVQENQAQLKYKNVTVSAKTMHEAIRDSLLLTNTVLTNHQRIILINEEVLRKIPMEAIINQSIRDNNTRRSCHVYLTKRPTKEILGRSEDGEIPSNVIYELKDNENRTNKILPPLTLGKASSNLQSDGSFAIQAVDIRGKKLILEGAGIINNSKLVGVMNDEDIAALNWLNGEVKGGIIEAVQHGEPLSVEVIDRKRRKITTEFNGDHLTINIEVGYTARLSEDWYGKENSFKEGYLKDVERVAEDEVKKDVEKVVYKLQHEYKTGVAGLYRYVENQHPKFWEKNKQKWDEIFSKADINYEVDLRIIDFGSKGGVK
ncbi:Ger(x)C family spore germination protein [Peribacillus frigoritolerans]|jgi:spore germination protein AC|uniref:Ger(x)C family spore germination protein n=1 Tax=Peribacillus frigoritolerans TaxID=450367 RepID=UPI00228244AA|nr:Ger(x)C family spore germination protein [Peribacillus frigoritolerans]MCY9004484.1 Ger(x)C family spore germination protein [Peribacillus frigoritolerans]